MYIYEYKHIHLYLHKETHIAEFGRETNKHSGVRLLFIIFLQDSAPVIGPKKALMKRSGMYEEYTSF